MNQSVLDQLDQVINKILFLKKKRVFEYQRVEFYPSEVHLLLVIRDGTSANATRMAEEMGITKGAVSQTLSRLESKGVLIKEKDPQRKNELTLSFTRFGASALRHYRSAAARVRQRHERCLDGCTRKEKEAIRRFLAGVAEVFDEF